MKLPLTLPPASRGVDFIALGENSLDVVAVIGGGVQPGAKEELDALKFLPGGQAATAAVACARLGWRSRYVGALGDDLAAERITESLSREGVSARWLRRSGVRCRMAIVLVQRDSGERSVLQYREPGLRIRPEEIEASSISDSRLVLVDATDVPAARHAANLARAAGVPTMVDVDLVVEEIETLLPLIDVLIVPASFPAQLYGAANVGEGLNRLKKDFRPAVAIATMGSEGSLALCEGREVRTPAPAIDVQDSTGAGDAFRGGLAAGWLEGGSEAELERILTIANAVAALNCRGVGAQTALPSREDLAALL